MISDQAVQTAADPVLQRLPHFDGARDFTRPDDRLREIKKRAAAFREEMLSGPQVTYYRSFTLVRVPYPTQWGFWRAAKVRTPLMHIVNRLFVIQFQTREGIKTLLVSPTDVEASKETPFFKRLGDKARIFGKPGERLIAPVYGTVEGYLEQIGLRPEDVDYISFDHLHTQDLRKWLGTGGSPGYFPRAKLLVTRAEWESFGAWLPLQRQWFVADGLRGVDPERAILLDHDTLVGEGFAIVHTPGHTEGNHSFVANTPEGLLVTSENGVSADSYAPLHSRIRGVAKYARMTGSEVILNGNTVEQGNDQYLSMVQEKEIAGPSRRNPDFTNFVPSSEMAAYWAFPGIKPTFSFGDLEFGTLHRPNP